MRNLPRLSLFLKFYFGLVLFFLLSRPLFLLYCGSLPDLASLPGVMLHGLKLDLATAGYLSIPLWLALLTSIWVKIPGLRLCYTVYIIIVSVMLSLIFVGNACLYGFWGIPLDSTVFVYLDQPGGAAASVSFLYMVCAVVAIAVVAVGLIYFLKKIFPFSVTAFLAVQGGKMKIIATLGSLLVAGLMFVGIRGGFDKSTNNPGTAYWSDVQILNHAAVNPAFSLFYSLSKSRDYAKEHDYFPEAERAKVFASLGYSTVSADTEPLLATKRPNVLIILMEGCGASFVHAVNPEASPDVTPNLNRIAREGIVFTHCYANSFRTDRGTVCALSGYPSFPDVSVMKLAAKCGALPSIARSLRHAGYQSPDFLYGGDANFTNTKGYLLSTGYGKINDQQTFTPAERKTHNWGVTDRITFERLLGMIGNRPADSPKPWHTTFLTLASHEPWGVPYNRIPQDKRLNAFAYLDDCIGRFIAKLKTMPQWKNTLIVILPDHGISYPDGIDDTDPRKSHIPMLWTGGAIRQHCVINRICNQTDLPATLLGQLGLPHGDFHFSRDVMSKTYTHPSATHTWSEGTYYMDGSGMTVINLVTKPQRVTVDSPAPSTFRKNAANALLQTAYDDLGSLGSGKR